MIRKVKYSFEMNGKYYGPNIELTEEEYNQAAALHADRVYVEGVIPSALKSTEELENEIAELQLELERRAAEKKAVVSQEAEETVVDSKEQKADANQTKKSNKK